MNNESEIAELLKSCEVKIPGCTYHQQIAKIDISDPEIIVISDLHLTEGRQADGNYLGTENFFADDAFERFLTHARGGIPENKTPLLIINGDFIDFLRILSVPRSDGQFQEWGEALAIVGAAMPEAELRGSIRRKDRKFGLGSQSFKSVWKIKKVIEGHAPFFRALAGWMNSGKKVFITKGNHDLEWYWPEVRNYLRFALAQILETASPAGVLKEKILPNLQFFDDAILINGAFYVEHGHRFDKFCRVLGKPVRRTGELNIPFGSFFNRFLINRIELAYPYLNNVRPSSNILPLLIRERFPLALKLLFFHLPFALRSVAGRYYRYMFGRFVTVILAVGIPLGLIGWEIFRKFGNVFSGQQEIRLPDFLDAGVKSFVLLVVSYFFSRLVAYFQLEEPDSLNDFAKKIFEKNPDYRVITMGHTHNPSQYRHKEKHFYNTGTWIPIIEISSAEVRHDNVYTFVRLQANSGGEFAATVIERWNDEAGRIEPLVIKKTK